MSPKKQNKQTNKKHSWTTLNVPKDWQASQFVWSIFISDTTRTPILNFQTKTQKVHRVRAAAGKINTSVKA